MYQTGGGRVTEIPLSLRDLKILERHGWVFIQVSEFRVQSSDKTKNCFTCVTFAKRVLGIRNPFIITPYQLYKGLAVL